MIDEFRFVLICGLAPAGIPSRLSADAAANYLKSGGGGATIPSVSGGFSPPTSRVMYRGRENSPYSAVWVAKAGVSGKYMALSTDWGLRCKELRVISAVFRAD